MATLELNCVRTSLFTRDCSLIVGSDQVAKVEAQADAGTELLLAVMGLRPLTAGIVCIDGAPLTPQSAPYFRQLTGYAPADVKLMPDSAIERSLQGGDNRPCTTAQWIVEALGLPQTLLGAVEAEGTALGFDTRDLAMPPSSLTCEQRRALLLATAVARTPKLLLVCHPLCPDTYLQHVATQRQMAILAVEDTTN
jgi:ABC-type protease/lipase transport system fused ATPase/permease subunit